MSSAANFLWHFCKKKLDIPCESSASRRIHMEWQALFSSTILKCCLLQINGGASVPINITRLNTYSNESKFSGIIPWHGWNILPLGNNDCLSVINGISLALWNIHFTLGPRYLFWHRKTNIHTWVQFKRQNVMTSFLLKNTICEYACKFIKWMYYSH